MGLTTAISRTLIDGKHNKSELLRRGSYLIPKDVFPCLGSTDEALDSKIASLRLLLQQIENLLVNDVEADDDDSGYPSSGESESAEEEDDARLMLL